LTMHPSNPVDVPERGEDLGKTLSQQLKEGGPTLVWRVGNRPKEIELLGGETGEGGRGTK